MSLTDFPALVDNFPVIDGATDDLNTPGKEHDDLHNKQSEAIVALQIKVGPDSTIVMLPAAGGVDDTAMVTAAKSAAGVNGTVIFTKGTYVTDGLTASVAGQHWSVWPAATIKAKNASNKPTVDVTASGVVIDGDGTIDGNRANQTAITPADAVQGTTAAVRVISVDKFRLRNMTIKDAGTLGVFADNVTNLTIRNNDFSGCGQAGNYKVITVYFTVGGSTSVRISGNKIDGVARQNGCIGVSLNAASRTVAKVRITGNECLVGNAGATATLGIELFTALGADIKDSVVSKNVITGSTGAGTNVYGISIGGVTPDATKGATNVTVTANTVRDCNLVAIELDGSGITCSANSTYNSGWIAVAAATPQAGGVRAVSVIGNTLVNSVNAAYAIHLSGNVDGIHGVVVEGNTIDNPAGSGIGADGVIRHLRVANNVMTRLKGPGFYTNASATITDSALTDNTFDLTGVGGTTADGIQISSIDVVGLKIVGNIIKGAARYGIYGQVALTGIEVIDNTITGCNQGLRTDDVATRWVVHGNNIHDNIDRGIIFFVAAVNLLIYGDSVYNNPGGDYYLVGSTFASFFVNGQAMTVP